MSEHVHYDWPVIEKKLRGALEEGFAALFQGAASDEERLLVEARRDLTEVNVIVTRVVIRLLNAGIDRQTVDVMVARNHGLWVRGMIENTVYRAEAREAFARALSGSDESARRVDLDFVPMQGGRA